MIEKINEVTKEILDLNTEFEVKYRVEPHVLIEFKKIVSEIPSNKTFLYVEGPDYYYTHPNYDNSSFGRYRRPSFGLDNGRSEWTIKFKPRDAKNNMKRIEMNWRVDNTPEADIKRGAELMGFKFNFEIIKSCQIYKFDDATLVFYTVYDVTDNPKSSKIDHFIEIEVSEKMIYEKQLTEDDALAIINKYEKILLPIGINPQKRLRKSLFEMYVRENK